MKAVTVLLSGCQTFGHALSGKELALRPVLPRSCKSWFCPQESVKKRLIHLRWGTTENRARTRFWRNDTGGTCGQWEA